MLRHLQIQLGVSLLLPKREGMEKCWNPQSVWSSINQTGICSLLRRAQDSLLTASSQTAPFRPRVAVILAPRWRAAEEWDAEPRWCVASLGRNRIRGSQEWISAMKSHFRGRPHWLSYVWGGTEGREWYSCGRTCVLEYCRIAYEFWNGKIWYFSLVSPRRELEQK